MQNEMRGFSKLSKNSKIDWIAKTYFSNPNHAVAILQQYWNSDQQLQKLHDDFTENTLSNFYLPFSVAPNVLINNKFYTVPMVIEESSVVAAASKAAKFWSTRGGFKTEVLNTQKIGQVHFTFNGSFEKLNTFFNEILPELHSETASFTKNMEARGGGILAINLRDKTALLENYYQLHVTFETKDSMGANFINTCLEQLAKTLVAQATVYQYFSDEEKQLTIIMSILSNYVTDCIVRAVVSCPVSDLKELDTDNPAEFASKFVTAVQIAQVEPYRAVTHNKGIMNGVDAVVIATGNDFRAVEAGAHAYAARHGSYASLSSANIKNGVFTFSLELPLALGTVGGLTSLHPMAKLALEILEKPNAQELMQIVAAVGLAQNFAALRSLTTSGIQEGHMKMHINNILNQFQASYSEREQIAMHFKHNPISHAAVVAFINKMRQK
jgi:hydroxymethylglutaryl-CoA reductase